MTLRGSVFVSLALSCSPEPPAKEPIATPAGPDAKSPTEFSIRLVNLCPQDMRYRIGPPRAPEGPERMIAGGASETIRMPPLQMVHTGGGSSARTDGDGVIWFGADCDSISATDDPSFDPRTARVPGRPQ